MKHKQPRTAKLWEALLPVALMIGFLGIQIIVFKSTPHIPLIFGTVFAGLMGLRLGYGWRHLERGIVNGIVIAIQACLILMVVGTLIGTWIISGIVPTMIYYGLKILSPTIFLFTTCLICSLVSLATGSSWSTAGTIGIALIGVGQGLGIPLSHVAGAIISGAYFGDKMSPLSDTTNLAPAVAGTDMFTHIRHMIFTTGPSLIFSLIIFIIMGLFYETSALQASSIQQILQVLDQEFFIHAVLLIPPLLIIFMVIFRIPALPALVGGAILGGIFAIVFQHSPVSTVMDAAQSGYVSESGLSAVDELLSRGGLESMMSTVALIICALSFGGAMEVTGMLEVIANAILSLAKSTGSLVLSTVLTCISMNIIAADQYLSIVIPGRMYKNAFRKRCLHPKNLSRALEDGGTLTSSLIPWNSGGAYMYATLGVYPFAYLPFAFLNLFNPLISIFYGYTGITMKKADKNNELQEEIVDENNA